MFEKIESLEVKYRSWYKGIPPKAIKLQIPGWAGDSHGHADGDKPQPWHCPPFVEGSTYGLELIYPFDTEVHVTNAGKIVFHGDFSSEQEGACMDFPFKIFAPGHFGFTSSLDLEPPPGYAIRLESHPRLYTDTTETVPMVVPGHLQGEWWPKVFFVVFKAPAPHQTYIFRKGEPYGQILIVPKKVSYDVIEMTAEEKQKRFKLDDKISKHGKRISKHSFVDDTGQDFNDKYKVVRKAFNKGGMDAVDCLFEEAAEEAAAEKTKEEKSARKRFGRRVLGLK